MGNDEGHEGEPGAGSAAAMPRSPVLRRTLISLGVLGLVLALVVGGGLWFLTDRYAGNIDRVADVFAGPRRGPVRRRQRPEQAASEEPVTFLLVGSDTRAHPAPGRIPDGRSDAIMIARFSGDRQHAQLISIPRDSWVDIPGHGKNKINAATRSAGRRCSSRPSSSSPRCGSTTT